MAAWREVFDFLVRVAGESGHSFTEEVASSLFDQVTNRYRDEMVRIAPPRRSRAEEVARLAVRLPTSAICQRLGVSRQYVQKVVAIKKRNPR